MRAHVMSDIHFEHMDKEFGENFFRQVEALKARDPAELLILAGDICQVGRHEAFWKSKLAQLCSYYQKVLYVPGNHEHYDTRFSVVDSFMKALKANPNFSNFVQLQDGPFEYRGRRFVGDTMWFPDTQESRWTKRMMSDFFVIYDFEPEVYRRHGEFLVKVAANLRHGDVVVTHHLPLPESVDAQYQGSPLNPFFMADMSRNLHEGNLPEMWIHGHTHTPCDYIKRVGVSEMRVYCNPHGYPHEGENTKFWDRIGVDIPDGP